MLRQQPSQEKYIDECLYCGEIKILTKEHFWSKWVRKHLASSSKKGTKTFHEVSSTKTNHVPHRGILARRGDALDQTLTVVCSECNNGRLSQLQDICKSQMKLLIDDKWLFLDRDSATKVSQWATMFTMTWESADVETMATSGLERKNFKDHYIIPPHWIVWIAPMADEFCRGMVNHFGAGPDMQGVARCTMQSTAFVVGRCFFMTYSTRRPELISPDPLFEKLFGLTRIWPLENQNSFFRPNHCIRDEKTVRDAAIFLAPPNIPRRTIAQYRPPTIKDNPQAKKGSPAKQIKSTSL